MNAFEMMKIIGFGFGREYTVQDFVALGSAYYIRGRRAMCIAPNGDFYIAAYGVDRFEGYEVYYGGIYKQTGGSGAFVLLDQTLYWWNCMCAAPNGDVYAAELVGDIYKQTGGTGPFVSLGLGGHSWMAMCAAPNGNIYASDGGNVYMQTGGVGAFNRIVYQVTNWNALCAAPNGDVYAAKLYGGIYKQTGGDGPFVSLYQADRWWYCMCAAPNGNIYAGEHAPGVDNDIYIQMGGTGNFFALGQGTQYTEWTMMCAAPNGNIYAGSTSTQIYMQDNN